MKRWSVLAASALALGFITSGVSSRSSCTLDDINVDPHFDTMAQFNEWKADIKPAIDACTAPGWDKSKIQWSEIPWMQPF
jgi:hypothetical protein